MSQSADLTNIDPMPQPDAERPGIAANGVPMHDTPNPGLSVQEIAAREGFGPMSGLGEHVWHGDARACVSCGYLVRRDEQLCRHCGQDLHDDMLSKMRMHSGPWYVKEHVRPFPGVSLDRLIRQVRRGVLQRSTVVRGPATFHQWRFAAETPVLAKYLGCCWSCQGDVHETDRRCGHCRADLDAGFGDMPADQSAGVRSKSQELVGLAEALTGIDGDEETVASPPAPGLLGRVAPHWIIAAMLILTLAGVYVVVDTRSKWQGTAERPQAARTSQSASPAEFESGEPADARSSAAEPAKSKPADSASPPPHEIKLDHMLHLPKSKSES